MTKMTPTIKVSPKKIKLNWYHDTPNTVKGATVYLWNKLLYLENTH